jgi:hypothetical protein
MPVADTDTKSKRLFYWRETPPGALHRSGRPMADIKAFGGQSFYDGGAGSTVE